MTSFPAKAVLAASVLVVLGVLAYRIQISPEQSAPEQGSRSSQEQIGRPLHPDVQDNAAAATQRGADDRIVIPSRYVFDQSEAVANASSWEETLAQLPQADAEYLRAINFRYFGALDFSDPAEFKQLVEQGFPLPEEWLAARRMLDAELEAKAKAGNAKAQMFLADRLTEQATALLELRDQTPAEYDGGRGAKTAVAANIASGALVKMSDSPFAAYVRGYALERLSIPRAPEYIAGAMIAASDRGDIRALDMLRRYQEGRPKMDATLILMVQQSMKHPPGGG